MTRIISMVAAIFISVFGVTNSHAALKFGTEEKIYFVADTTVLGADGEKLYLARKITTHSFLLPFSIHDDGFVMGISGKSTNYYPFPDVSTLKELQEEGLLPKPLPMWKLPILDQILGLSLWVALFGLVIFFGIKKLRSRYQKMILQNIPNSGYVKPEAE